MKYVLDASAVLSVLQNEQGREKVEPILDQAVIGRVNVTEVLTTLINKGMPLSDAIAAFHALDLQVLEFDQNQSELTASLRDATRHLGLSLGDRACLALSIKENATAVTADKTWASLAMCTIEVIR